MTRSRDSAQVRAEAAKERFAEDFDGGSGIETRFAKLARLMVDWVDLDSKTW